MHSAVLLLITSRRRGRFKVECWVWSQTGMCRNIRTLFNFEPPATEEEIRAAALQFVRKISGFNKPSKANEVAFYSAVDDIARITSRLLVSLESTATPKNRQEEAARARARAARRYGRVAEPPDGRA